MKFGIRDHAERINHRRDIYPQGDDFIEHNLEVTVLGSHRRENHTESHRHQRQEDYEEREEHYLPMNLQLSTGSGIIDIESRKNSQLYSKTEQIGSHRHQGHDDTREIDFSEDICV